MAPPNIDDNDRASKVASTRHDKLIVSLTQDLKGTNTHLLPEEWSKQVQTRQTTGKICPLFVAPSWRLCSSPSCTHPHGIWTPPWIRLSPLASAERKRPAVGACVVLYRHFISVANLHEINLDPGRMLRRPVISEASN